MSKTPSFTATNRRKNQLSQLRHAAIALSILLLAPLASAQVSGTVVDELGNPVADAIVSLQASDFRTTTATDGTFDMPNATGSATYVVAAKPGCFNSALYVASTPMTNIALTIEEVPHWDDPDFELNDPESCSGCHPEQYAEWNGSPMQQGGTNLWLYDIYNGTGTPGGMGGFVYTRDSSHLSHAPFSDCAPCHQPVPWVKEKDPLSGLDDIDALSQGAMHGISCDVCHKIAEVDESKMDYPGLFPEQTTFIKPPLSASPMGIHEPVMFGALADTSFSNPFMRAAYNPQIESSMCCACHQDTNDHDDDGEFGDPGSIVSEPTWDEWSTSEYSDPDSPHYATCVDCHMQSGGRNYASALPFAPFRDSETLGGHDVRGTTALFLENAADVDMTVNQNGTTLSVDVDVFNSMTGHSLPTGVTVRNVFLLVEATRDSDGAALAHTGSQVLHDLVGVGDPAQGYFAGLPGKMFGKHNLGATGAGPTFYTEATDVLFDTRIQALAHDITHYTFDVPAGTGDVSVRARLIYRRSYTFLTDAKGWVVDGKGNPLEDKIAPHFGHLMEDRHFPDAGLSVSAPVLVAGVPAVIEAQGAWEGNMVAFLASSTGTGTTPTPYGFDLGLGGRIFQLGNAVANSNGVASVTTFALPVYTAGWQIWMQAVEVQGAATYELSDVSSAVVQ